MDYELLKKELLVGNEIVDYQHSELVDQLQKLHNAMKSGQGRAVIGGIFDFLSDYVVKHFLEEELLVENSGIISPFKTKNMIEHKNFIQRLEKLKNDYKNNVLSITLEIYNELSSWIINHIKNIDKQIFLSKRI